LTRGKTVDDAIAGFQHALEQRDALIAFEQLGPREGSVN